MNGDQTMDTTTLESMIGKLIDSIETLDLSIDFLSAIMSGEEALGIQFGQKAYGRAIATPSVAAPEGVVAEGLNIRSFYINKIDKIVQEEAENVRKKANE
tara:strand:- start:63 stop:362 length:300 start_codon:yes stop_codon:yes gene_type:complete